MRIAVSALLLLSSCAAAPAPMPAPGPAPAGPEPSTDARAGWTATLSTLAHGVSGRATIVDENTFRLDDFFYDGSGIIVYAYLGDVDSNAAFASGLQTGPQLVGTPFEGDSLEIDLPSGQTLDGYTALSIWCVAFGVNFGSGTFVDPG